jgi:hypothetical protein
VTELALAGWSWAVELDVGASCDACEWEVCESLLTSKVGVWSLLPGLLLLTTIPCD